MSASDATDDLRFKNHVEKGPVCEVRHREPGDRTQRGLIVEYSCEFLADSFPECEVLALAVEHAFAHLFRATALGNFGQQLLVGLLQIGRTVQDTCIEL